MFNFLKSDWLKLLGQSEFQGMPAAPEAAESKHQNLSLFWATDFLGSSSGGSAAFGYGEFFFDLKGLMSCVRRWVDTTGVKSDDLMARR